MYLKDMKIPFRKHFLGDTEEEAIQNYNKYLKLVSSLAKGYSKLSGADYDDLVSEGIFGLARAIRDSKRPDQPCKLKTLAIFWIKDALRHAVHKAEAPACGATLRLKDINYLISKLTEILNILDLSEEEKKNLIEKEETVLNEKFGDYCSKVLDLKKRIKRRAYFSYKNAVCAAEDFPRRTLKEAEDSCTMNDEGIDTENCFNDLYHSLGETNFTILYKRFTLGYSLEELAKQNGVSSSCMSQRIKQLVKTAGKWRNNDNPRSNKKSGCRVQS